MNLPAVGPVPAGIACEVWEALAACIIPQSSVMAQLHFMRRAQPGTIGIARIAIADPEQLATAGSDFHGCDQPPRLGLSL